MRHAMGAVLRARVVAHGHVEREPESLPLSFRGDAFAVAPHPALLRAIMGMENRRRSLCNGRRIDIARLVGDHLEVVRVLPPFRRWLLQPKKRIHCHNVADAEAAAVDFARYPSSTGCANTVESLSSALRILSLSSSSCSCLRDIHAH